MSGGWTEDGEALGFVGSPRKFPEASKTKRADYGWNEIWVWKVVNTDEKCLWIPTRQSRNLVSRPWVSFPEWKGNEHPSWGQGLTEATGLYLAPCGISGPEAHSGQMFHLLCFILQLKI